MRSGAGAALRSPTDEAARSRCAPLAEQIGARAMVPAIGVAAKAVTTLAMSGPSAEPQPDSARIRPTLIRRVTSRAERRARRRPDGPSLAGGGHSLEAPLGAHGLCAGCRHATARTEDLAAGRLPPDLPVRGSRPPGDLGSALQPCLGDRPVSASVSAPFRARVLPRVLTAGCVVQAADGIPCGLAHRKGHDGFASPARKDPPHGARSARGNSDIPLPRRIVRPVRASGGRHLELV